MKTNSDSPVFCGTDFSANAAQAATVAAALAAQSGCSLVLIHVADEFNGCIGNPKALQVLVREAEKRLSDESLRLKEVGVPIETKILTGKVAEQAILEYSRERPASLLVVSSVSKTTFDRWTVGSVSERLAQSHAAPTLVVRSVAPFEIWRQAERPLRVFVAVDFSPPATAALQWLQRFRKLGPCEIVAAHVNFPPEDAGRLGIATHAFKNSPELQRVLERDLKKKIHDHLDAEDVRVVVEPAIGRPDARLIELATEAKVDLVVTGTSQSRGLSRIWHATARGILHHASMSVVCVPATAQPEEEPLPAIQRVLVATDFSELGNRAVRQACALLTDGGTLHLLHVLEPVSRPGALTLAAGEILEIEQSRQQARKEEAIHRLRALVPISAQTSTGSELPPEEQSLGDGPGIRSEVHVVESDDAAKTIDQAGERFDADVICLGSHGYSALSAAVMGSVTRSMMAHSQRPLLIVPLSRA